MEPILDSSWMQQMMTAKVREKFIYCSYRAVALEIPAGSLQKSPYHYRILFFSEESHMPVLSLNLESSILGSYLFTEHEGKNHLNLGHTEEELSYEDFRKWALDRAGVELH
ncbi:MAG: hypothetical protein HN368_20840 [Spirochaetales bacterium]|jgi:hypothetical protein|nr:hypothetical protein [Spirochaetales bacterium]